MAEEVVCVVVKHNLVCSISRHLAPPPDIALPQTRLEAAARLAANHRRNGSIDGEYFFEDPQRARVFALLCLEFMKRTVEKRANAIERLGPGEGYVSEMSTPSSQPADQPARK